MLATIVFIRRDIVLVCEIVSIRIWGSASLQKSNKFTHVPYTHVKCYVLHRYNVCSKSTHKRCYIHMLLYVLVLYNRAVQLTEFGKAEYFIWTSTLVSFAVFCINDFDTVLRMHVILNSNLLYCFKRTFILAAKRFLKETKMNKHNFCPLAQNISSCVLMVWVIFCVCVCVYFRPHGAIVSYKWRFV
jgi:hypothetical protein